MNDPEDLLKRAEQLKREEEAREQAKTHADLPLLVRMLADFRARSTFAKNVIGTLDVIWNHWLRPIAWVLNPLARGYWALVKWVFAKVSIVEGVYDRYRGAAAAVVLTLFTAFFGWGLITRFVPATIELAYDAVTINVFSHKDTLIFSQPQNVEGQPDVLRVYACRAYPCEGQTDSVEYRVRDSLYLDAVRLLTRFEPHDPGEQAGAFVSEENACTVMAYGVRNKVAGLVPLHHGCHMSVYQWLKL